MRSALTTEAIFCAMTIVVVPFKSRLSASRTSFSERASNALVLSSKIKIFGSPITPRVMDSRCFCPPEKLLLRSSTGAS